VSAGAIIDLLAEVSRRGQHLVDQIGHAVRSAKELHSDETGWAENGQYDASGRCPPKASAICKSRSDARPDGAKPDRDEQDRTLITDFFASYNKIPGRHQRCWLISSALSTNSAPITGEHISRTMVCSRYRSVATGQSLPAILSERTTFGAAIFDRRRKRRKLEKQLYALAEPISKRTHRLFRRPRSHAE